MQITDYSIFMTVLWSSALIVLFYFLRKNKKMVDICSVSGILALYAFCMVRLLLPAEFPGVHVVALPALYNPFWNLIQRRVMIFGHSVVLFYAVFQTIWIVTAIILIIAVMRKYFGFTRAVRRWADRDVSISAELYDDIFGRERVKPLLLRSDMYDTPVSSGIYQPFILLPVRQYADDELKYILLHEAAHIRNGDVLIQMLVNILCALYWWNPLVYLMQHDLGQAFELRADRAVLQKIGAGEKADYLEMIKMIYESGSGRPAELRHGVGLLGAKERGSDLLERFVIAERNGYGRGRLGMYVAIFAAAATLVVSYTFIFQSKFEIPSYEYQITGQNSYLVHKTNGSYEMHGQDGGIAPINSESMISQFIGDGFIVIEEGETK